MQNGSGNLYFLIFSSSFITDKKCFSSLLSISTSRSLVRLFRAKPFFVQGANGCLPTALPTVRFLLCFSILNIPYMRYCRLCKLFVSRQMCLGRARFLCFYSFSLMRSHQDFPIAVFPTKYFSVYFYVGAACFCRSISYERNKAHAEYTVHSTKKRLLDKRFVKYNIK